METLLFVLGCIVLPAVCAYALWGLWCGLYYVPSEDADEEVGMFG